MLPIRSCSFLNLCAFTKRVLRSYLCFSSKANNALSCTSNSLQTVFKQYHNPCHAMSIISCIQIHKPPSIWRPNLQVWWLPPSLAEQVAAPERAAPSRAKLRGCFGRATSAASSKASRWATFSSVPVVEWWAPLAARLGRRPDPCCRRPWAAPGSRTSREVGASPGTVETAPASMWWTGLTFIS